MASPRSSFFTSGRRLPYLDSYIIVEQAYVQHIRPEIQDAPDKTPILFVHGGGLTGASWETTPDGRPGWAVRAAEAGHPVYVIDGIDSGRSARAPDAERVGDVEYRTASQVWERFRFGPPDQFETRTPYPGGQFPTEAFDRLLAVQVPRRRNTDDIEAQGVAEVIEHLGPCYVISHSHGATVTLKAVKDKETAARVKALVCVEPGSTANSSSLHPDIRTLIIWGDFLDHPSGWPKFVEGWTNGAPAAVQTIHLPLIDIKGNSHFPMSDRNSDKVMETLLKWIRDD